MTVFGKPAQSRPQHPPHVLPPHQITRNKAWDLASSRENFCEEEGSSASSPRQPNLWDRAGEWTARTLATPEDAAGMAVSPPAPLLPVALCTSFREGSPLWLVHQVPL